MATAPNSDHAYADYLNGMKYKDIAAKYGVTINTVKSWKSRYQWSRDDKKVCTQKAKSVHTKNDRKKSEKRYRNRVHGRIVRKCRIDRKTKAFLYILRALFQCHKGVSKDI